MNFEVVEPGWLTSRNRSARVSATYISRRSPSKARHVDLLQNFAVGRQPQLASRKRSGIANYVNAGDGGIFTASRAKRDCF